MFIILDVLFCACTCISELELTLWQPLDPKSGPTKIRPLSVMHFMTKQTGFLKEAQMCVCSSQAIVSCTVQHLTPYCCSEISSEEQGGFRDIPQENAALEPETFSSQQAASVCRQPGPGGQHSLGGVMTSCSPHRLTHMLADINRGRPEYVLAKGKQKKKIANVNILD